MLHPEIAYVELLELIRDISNDHKFPLDIELIEKISAVIVGLVYAHRDARKEVAEKVNQIENILKADLIKTMRRTKSYNEKEKLKKIKKILN